MGKIKLQKIVGNLLFKLRKLYMNGTAIQKSLVFLKPQKILGNVCFSEQIFHRKKSLGAPVSWLNCFLYFGVLKCEQLNPIWSGSLVSWILDSNLQQDSGFLVLDSGFQSRGFRIPEAKNSRIPESGFPHMGRKMTNFCQQVLLRSVLLYGVFSLDLNNKPSNPRYFQKGFNKFL